MTREGHAKIGSAAPPAGWVQSLRDAAPAPEPVPCARPSHLSGRDEPRREGIVHTARFYSASLLGRCLREIHPESATDSMRRGLWSSDSEHFDPLISRLLLLVARARDQWRPRRAPRGAGRMRIICLSVPPSLSLQELGLCPSVLASAMCGVRWSLLLHMKFQGIFRLRAMAELGLEPDAAAPRPRGPRGGR